MNHNLATSQRAFVAAAGRSTESFFAGGFIGDRQGMVPTESDFALTAVLASPLPDANFALSHEPSNGNAATDIYFIQAP